MAFRLLRPRQPGRRTFLRRQFAAMLSAILLWLCAIIAAGFVAARADGESYRPIILIGLLLPLALLLLATGVQQFADRIHSGDSR
jgi:membrane-anchored protein YejM (alkaline phosphatase superfamily)